MTKNRIRQSPQSLKTIYNAKMPFVKVIHCKNKSIVLVFYCLILHLNVNVEVLFLLDNNLWSIEQLKSYLSYVKSLKPVMAH